MSIVPKFDKLPRHLEDIDLFGLLGIDKTTNRTEVDEAYLRIENPTGDQFTAWKLLRDEAYSALYQSTGSILKAVEAGFVVDSMSFDQITSTDYSSKLCVTPTFKIKSNIQGIQDDLPLIVLVTTGAFSPLHYGHLSMMETARKALQAQGRHVVGGYISPSHDAYVSTKYNGEASLSAAHRTHIARKAVDSSDWLMVDPWEGSYLPTDVNFTDVIRHIKDHLRFVFPGQPVEVYYVFGADNACFTRVLQYMDGGVCVSRSSSFNPRPSIFAGEGIVDNSRLIFVRSDDETSDFSSTAVRKWKPQLMPKDASIDYFGWKKTLITDDLDVPLPPQNYIIRDDIEWALAQYFVGNFPEDVLAAADTFKFGLKKLIESSFANAVLPDRSREIRVFFYSQAEQYKVAKHIESASPTLNIDTATNDGKGINFSRMFEISDSQFRPTGLISRPGYAPIEEQIRSINPGVYTFLDDDIASGATLNLFMGMLPETVTIGSIRTLFSHSRRILSDSNQHECLDVVDVRDFLLGSRAGGLVVGGIGDNDMVRAPYVEPFVNLNSRAYIPLSMCRSFSIGVWQLNYDFYKALDNKFTLAEASKEFRELMLRLGFDNTDTLHEIAGYYLDRLIGISQ
jgi:Cytidylyltransferase-like